VIAIYGDFNCPYSYLASRRVGGRRLDGAAHHEIAMEFEAVRQLLMPGDDFDASAPSILPNTAAANAGYAQALDSGVGHDVRRLLFEAYWLRGVDIGSVEVLRALFAEPVRRGYSSAFPRREVGFAVRTNRGPIATAAYRLVIAWRVCWEELATWTTPTVVVDGRVYVGVDGLRRLGAERAAFGAHLSIEHD
jgi:2-hydroxychromene-2-carboxylate isomerase